MVRFLKSSKLYRKPDFRKKSLELGVEERWYQGTRTELSFVKIRNDIQ